MTDDIIPSPNIWNDPDVYEVGEPRGRSRAPHRVGHAAPCTTGRGSGCSDVGCGSGFHLPLFARAAASVVGVEPHSPLVELARERLAALGPATGEVEVLEGAAQELPLEDCSVDVAHARWAYFFGPGCEPGLAELARVLRPGGTAFVIDNDASRSTFGGWFRRSLPHHDPVAVERFWTRQGWSRERIDTRWAFDSRETFESVVRIEFPPTIADGILAEHEGTGVDYAVNLWWRTFP